MFTLTLTQSLLEMSRGGSVNPHPSAETPPNTNPKWQVELLSYIVKWLPEPPLQGGLVRTCSASSQGHRFHPTCPPHLGEVLKCVV